MAEKLASRQMLYLHNKLRVAPLNIVHTLERSPRRGETLKLNEKLSAFITGNSDECRSGVFQARAVGVCEQGKNLIDAALRFIQWMVLGDRLYEEPILPEYRQVGARRVYGYAVATILIFNLDAVSSINEHRHYIPPLLKRRECRKVCLTIVETEDT
jgi:hypothetical protein